MRKEESASPGKDPNGFIEKTIAAFVENSPSNRRKADGGRYFDAPLVGYASGNDPLFMRYKKIIGRFHLTPREAFDLTFGEEAGMKRLSVIAWIRAS